MLTVGRIVRAHGVRGEVTVHVRTDVPDERFGPGSVLNVTASARTASSGRPRTSSGSSPVRSAGRDIPAGQRLPSSLTVNRIRWHQGRLLVVFDGITDRTAAESLRGAELQVEVDDAEQPSDPEEFFDHQLTGLRVVTTEGDDVGEVAEVIHGAAQDMLAVRLPDGSQALVPFVSAIVPDIDVDAGRVVIDPPAGLLDLHLSGESER
ncbi:ribosome maturation factor RimM [Phytoactinopolyspora alkaliphila]|uniref:Ribosome maturation factor RimM n=1 Tax=Phytoactinopolyspora alkaliphila TaxID=1783498 RepID=A0A6N9YPT7_9ACTN|nr:ribosome maturation factor RimM [Phytoactinopolyspora alkaliphila]